MSEDMVSDIIKEAGFGKLMLGATKSYLNMTYNPAKAGKVIGGLALAGAGYSVMKKPSNAVDVVAPYAKGMREGGQEIVNSFKEFGKVTAPVAPPSMLNNGVNKLAEEVLDPEYRSLEKTAARIMEDVEKLAAEGPEGADPVSTLILSAGVGTGAGIAGYIGANALGKGFASAMENPIAHAAMDNAASQIGKNTMNSMAKKPIAQLFKQTMTSTGKALGSNRERVNFKTLSGGPPIYKTLAAGAGLLGTLTAINAAEEYIGEKVKNELAKKSDEDITELIKEAGINDFAKAHPIETFVGLPLGIAGATAFGKSSYKNQKDDNTNLEMAQDKMNGAIKNKEHWEKMTPAEKVKYVSADYEHNDSHNISNIMRVYPVACEGTAYYGDTVDRVLKARGIDRNKMNFKQYRDTVEGMSNVMNSGSPYNKDYSNREDPDFDMASDVLDDVLNKAKLDKTAGAIVNTLGIGLLGSIGGHKLGKATANVFNRETPEVKETKAKLREIKREQYTQDETIYNVIDDIRENNPVYLDKYNDMTVGDVENVVYDDIYNMAYPKKVACDEVSDLIKEAQLSDFQSRMIADKVIRPMATTSVFLGSLALMSRASGRNLYGGFEKLQPEDTDTKKTVVDIPLTQLDNEKRVKVQVEKSASESLELEKVADLRSSIMSKLKGVAKEAPKVEKEYTGTMADFVDDEVVKKSRTDILKEKIDTWADKHPLTKGMGDVLGRDHEYKGRKGVGHLVVEEAPGKIIEGMAYMTPMMLVAGLTGRNLKRGLAPIDQAQQQQQAPPPPGMARLTIEEPKMNRSV